MWMLLDYKRNRRHETESVFGRREVRKRGRERSLLIGSEEKQKTLRLILLEIGRA